MNPGKEAPISDIPSRDRKPRVRENEKEIERLVEKAAHGDTEAAWALIQMLIDALDDGAVSRPLFKFAADYFDALWQIRSDKRPKEPTRVQYGAALDKLHILHSRRGRPEKDGTEIVAILAAEECLRGSSPAGAKGDCQGEQSPKRTADDAREQLTRIGLSEDTLRDLRTNNPGLVDIAQSLTAAEREALFEGMGWDVKK